MAIAIAIPFPSSGAREIPRPPLLRGGARVYSPFGARRLSRPMAVRLEPVAARGAAAPAARGRSPLSRLRRG
jgi:hypothetical protein